MLLWILGAAFLVLALGLLLAARAQRRRCHLLQTTETSRAADLQTMARSVGEEIGPGSFRQIAEVKGTVRCHQPLQSELARAGCVFYAMKVVREYEETYWETDSRGNRSRRHRRESEVMAENTRAIPFEVEDSSGRILVDPAGAKVTAEEVVDRFEQGDPGAPSLSLGSWQFDLGPLALLGDRRTIGYRYQERVVPVDRPIFVLGEASDASGQLMIGRPAAKAPPFLVSTRSEEELTRSALKAWRWLLAGAVVSGLAGAVMLIVKLVS